MRQTLRLLAGDLAAQDQLARALPQAVALPTRLEALCRLWAEDEHAFDSRLFAARADHVGGAAPAQQQAHGVDDDRLAGARLAREHVKPRLKGQVQSLDDGEIGYRELDEQRLFLP